jgi:calcium-dependent protein kinase
MGCCALTPKKQPPKNTLTKPAPPKSTQAIDVEEIKFKEIKFQKQMFVKQKEGKAESKFRYVRQLGRGTFGTVYFATDRETGINRAIKVISKSSRNGVAISDIKNEIDLLKRLDHPNIVQIYECYESETSFCLVTEYCSGGELFDFIIQRTSLSETTNARILFQILSAIAYCHSQGVVHRDLKPENLLMASPNECNSLKVADFGTSTIFTGKTVLKEKLGTAYYVAPEVLKMRYDEKCDLWSCGVILYILISGEPPFNGKNDSEIMANVMKGSYSLDHGKWPFVSEGAKHLITKLLKYNPQERISALEALQDPWIRSHMEEDASSAMSPSPTSFSSTLEKLSRLKAFKKIQQGVRTFIASQLASEEDKLKLTKVFRQLDANGDGRLSREELVSGYSRTMTEAEAQLTVDGVMRSCDADGNGFIEYTEFIAATMQFHTEQAKTMLQHAFQAFDSDGNGRLSHDEIRHILGDETSTVGIWREITKLCDRNGDGEIDIQEFHDLIMGLDI